MGLTGLLDRLIYRQVEYARHGADFLAYPLARTDEQGVDEGLRRESGFTH